MNPTLWLNSLRGFDYKHWLNKSIDKMETKINGYNTKSNHSNLSNLTKRQYLSLWIIIENNSLIFFSSKLLRSKLISYSIYDLFIRLHALIQQNSVSEKIISFENNSIQGVFVQNIFQENFSFIRPHSRSA
jgi:hypothetical protein